MTSKMPDLWAELPRESELLGDPSEEVTKNAPVTPGEQKEIVGRLRETEEYLRRKYSLSDEQIRVLGAKVDYLIDAAGRLGRTDWRGLFVGVMGECSAAGS